MNSDCSLFKLKEITEKIGSGATPTGGKSAYKISGISLIRSQNVLDYSFSSQNLAFIDEKQAKKLNVVTVEPNDILINITGDSVARVCRVPLDILPARVNQHVSIIRTNNLADCYYLLYYLQSIKHELLQMASSGGTRNALTKQMLENIEISLPLLPVQKKIASILSSLDDKIELNTRMNKVLEEIARALFHRWFVEFEFPDADGRPYKSAGGKMVESEMGSVPEGWSVGTIGNIANITMGQSPKGDSYNELGIGDVFYQGRAEFGTRFPTRRLFTTEPKRMAKRGDVLMSVRAPVGDLNVATEKCCIGRGLAAIQSKNGNNSFILYTMMKLQRELDVFNGEGTVFGSINKSSLHNMNILIPQEELIKKFEGIVSIIDLQIVMHYFENEHLQNIRDTLLPKLMSGELK